MKKKDKYKSLHLQVVHVNNTIANICNLKKLIMNFLACENSVLLHNHAFSVPIISRTNETSIGIGLIPLFY
jgi:hypothetical protein